ncbi:hypothetical protein [Brevibacillus marinus]|nr:hypothetical protein [Brevibacillus marinus]
MLTPNIFKRALIWALFFVLSFITVQVWDSGNAAPEGTQPVQNEQKNG